MVNKQKGRQKEKAFHFGLYRLKYELLGFKYRTIEIILIVT